VRFALNLKDINAMLQQILISLLLWHSLGVPFVDDFHFTVNYYICIIQTIILIHQNLYNIKILSIDATTKLKLRNIW